MGAGDGEDARVLSELAAGRAVVVRLPPRGQPYPPLLRRLAGEGRLVRIGRPSRWGNPHRIGLDGTREQVVARYRDHLAARPDLLARLPELRGRALGCFCHPLPCHGDVLAEAAEHAGPAGGATGPRPGETRRSAP